MKVYDGAMDGWSEITKQNASIKELLVGFGLAFLLERKFGYGMFIVM